MTIGEELDLHTRLLGNLEDDVDVTHTRLRAATKRVRHIIKHSSNWKGGLFIFCLIVVLTLVLLVALKVRGHRLGLAAESALRLPIANVRRHCGCTRGVATSMRGQLTSTPCPPRPHAPRLQVIRIFH